MQEQTASSEACPVTAKSDVCHIGGAGVCIFKTGLIALLWMSFAFVRPHVARIYEDFDSKLPGLTYATFVIPTAVLMILIPAVLVAIAYAQHVVKGNARLIRRAQEWGLLAFLVLAVGYFFAMIWPILDLYIDLT